MAVDNIKKNGTSNAYKPNAGGATLISEPVIGIVKNNIDPTRSGMIDIYVAKMGGTDPDDSTNWIRGVKYLSPFYGVSGQGSEKTGDGKFVGNPQSYGFWASAPDIGTEVVCIFANGLATQGYYIGCVPKPGLLQMTPAMGASSNVVPNEAEGASYGGADRLPTSEVNYSNPTVNKSPQIYNEPKPIHSYQAAILSAQGLVRDNIRGVISSSAQRETPSRVFGFSTPGGPMFEGGYTSQTIKDAVKTADPSKLKQVGRTGGHSFVMDDGTLTGQDQLIRLRSSAGHQITMSDTGQTLFIIHSNGQSWIEMGKEGTIDIYSTNSFNVRTQGDINFHADRDINLNAAKNLNMFGENINIESSKNYSQRVGVNYSQYTMGKYTVKVDGAMSQQSAGQASYVSSAETFINGSKVNLNSGSAATTPSTVPIIPKTNHIDTTNSPTVGWMNPSPNPLISVTNRAPAHQPWIGAGKGVDVKVESSPPSQTSQSSPATTAVNAATPTTPTAQTTPAAVASTPATTGNSVLPPETKQAITSQIATNAQSAAGVAPGAAANQVSTAANQAAAGAVNQAVGAVNGVLSTASGATVAMAAAAGDLKPGYDKLATSLQAAGMPLDKALTGATTALNGVTSATQLVGNVAQQARVVSTAIDNATSSLLSTGTITGKENPLQVAGLITGAVTNGIAAVTNFVNTGVTAVTGLVNNIASGRFAAGLADSLSLGGLKQSLSGMADGLKNTVTALGDSVANLASGLKTGLQSAFAAVEKSFGTLKAGVANVLGPKTDGAAATKQPSDVSKASDAYTIAEAEVETATDALFTAKRNYRNEQTPQNATALETAEANLAAAKQKKAQASTAFLKSTVGGAVSAIIPAGATSGLGLDSAIASVSSAVSGAANGALGAINNAVNSAAGAVGGAVGALGGAVNSVTGAVGGVVGAVGGVVTGTVNQVTGAVNGVVNSVTGVVNSVAGIANNPVGAVKNSLNSGLNALPGGAEVLQSVTNNGPIGALAATTSTALNAVNSTLSAVGGIAGNVDKLAGDLVGGTKGLIDQSMAQAAGLATGALGELKAGAAGVMAQLETTMASVSSGANSIKAAAAAVGTFDNSAIIAKTGQLLGDAKIPSPSSIFAGNALPPANATAASAAVTAAYNAVKEASAEEDKAALALESTIKLMNKNPGNNGQYLEQLEQQTKALEAASEKLTLAQNAYSTAVTS